MPQEQIATLHAHAYRSLGRPTLCVDGEPAKEWNEHCLKIGQPRWAIRPTGKTPDRDDLHDDAGGESEVLAEYHRLRSRLTPRDAWSLSVKAFASAYEEWKRENEYVDFSDVIHDAYQTIDSAPGLPSVIMVDEAQDHDRAELRLVRKWARNAERVVIVGDPDQNLYQWRGSDPEAFYEVPIPDANNRVLAQSYRVPLAVHAEAMKMIGRVRNRKPVAYHPRLDEDGNVVEGQVRRLDEAMTDRRVEDVVNAAMPYLDAGKRVMFLAACEYLLRPLCRELKDRAIPYWNPFARDRGLFNPLTPAKGVPAGQRLLNYLLPQEKFYGDGARFWTWQELHTWVEVCRADGLLKHGAKAMIERRAKDEPALLGFHDVAECFESEVIERMDADPLAVFQGFVKKERAASVEFALRVLRKRGVEELEKQPRCTVGTVHSVKGGESDVVIVAPDLSPQGFDQYEDARQQDAIFRLFYVAFTRARETLILCEPGSRRCVDW